ncbi:MAG: glycosyltransferase family 4 protein [Candidatus Moranbacteria bacterium]|nr:glycosyltransferase family 4 protein [Candidatus Moranbacteria bacterium]
MVRILFLNYEYPPLGGGAGNATYYILKELAKNPDLQIDLVTSSVGKYKTEKISPNVAVHYLDIGKTGDPHYQKIKDLIYYSIRSYFYAKDLIRKNKYDLIHAFFGIPCGFIAMLLGLPYIVSLRGSDVPGYNERFRLFDRIFLKTISRRVWKKAQIVTALSQDLLNLARFTDKDKKIEVIYNGINTDEFYPDEIALNKEKNFNILFVGRLIKRKGLIYLLDAFINLQKVHPHIRLIVAGSGPLMDCFKNYCIKNNISEKVNFLGVLGHKELNKVYQKSHVFVISSLNEALGNVTLEALAVGLPVITTKTGAAELISDNGIIVEKGSSAQIAQALEKLINDESLRKNMGAKSRRIALGMGWHNVASKYLKIYETIARKNENK